MTKAFFRLHARLTDEWDLPARLDFPALKRYDALYREVLREIGQPEHLLLNHFRPKPGHEERLKGLLAAVATARAHRRVASE